MVHGRGAHPGEQGGSGDQAIAGTQDRSPQPRSPRAEAPVNVIRRLGGRVLREEGAWGGQGTLCPISRWCIPFNHTGCSTPGTRYNACALLSLFVCFGFLLGGLAGGQ